MATVDEGVTVTKTRGHQLLRQTGVSASASLPDLRHLAAVKFSANSATNTSLDLHNTDAVSASPPDSR